jgi:hypothetical protein
MVGMPGSGKTTYLAMLSNMLVDNCNDMKLSKKAEDIPEGYEYFSKFGRQLLECKELDRTRRLEYNSLKISLWDDVENEYLLDVPDISGEVFRDLVKDRRINRDIAKRIQESDCLLFFINYKNMSWERRIPLKRRNIGEKNIYYMENKEPNSVLVSKREANQSEIVELLQTLFDLELNKPYIRFILSAWDRVEEEKGTDILPSKFVKKMFPLLHQFVETNSNYFKAEYWGVSAQGGDFRNPKDVERIEEEEYNAIKVVEPTGRKTNDLTALLYLG